MRTRILRQSAFCIHPEWSISQVELKILVLLLFCTADIEQSASCTTAPKQPVFRQDSRNHRLYGEFWFLQSSCESVWENPCCWKHVCRQGKSLYDLVLSSQSQNFVTLHRYCSKLTNSHVIRCHFISFHFCYSRPHNRNGPVIIFSRSDHQSTAKILAIKKPVV